MLRSAKGSSLAPRPERTTPCSGLFSSWRLRYSAEIGLQVSSINATHHKAVLHGITLHLWLCVYKT